MNYISVFPTVGAIIGLVLGIIFWMDEKAFDYPGFHVSVHVVLTFFCISNVWYVYRDFYKRGNRGIIWDK